MSELPTPVQWAKEARAEMAREKITAKRLATHIGVSYPTIIRWLNGGCKEIESMRIVNDAIANMKGNS